MLRGAMHARCALLLLDGVDEGGRKRAAIERHVTEVLAPQGHSLLVTSRPAGLELARYEAHFLALELQPLDEAQQRAVVTRRVGDVAGDLLWRELEATAPRDEKGARVTSNPLVRRDCLPRVHGLLSAQHPVCCLRVARRLSAAYVCLALGSMGRC